MTKLKIVKAGDIYVELNQAHAMKFVVLKSEEYISVSELAKLLCDLNDGGCWIGQNDSRYDAFNYLLELLGKPMSCNKKEKKEG